MKNFCGFSKAIVLFIALSTLSCSKTEDQPVIELVPTSLKGKTIIYFGDSLIENKNLPEKVAALTEATVIKQGYGGCRMAKHSLGVNGQLYDKMSMYNLSGYIKNKDFSTLSETTLELVKKLGDDNRTQANVLSKIDFSKVDVALISFGTNDYGSTDGALIGTNNDKTGETFKGAMNKVIMDFKAVNPKIQLVFTTAVYRSRYQTVGDGKNSDDYVNPQGLKLDDYNRAIIEICKINSIPYLDLNKLSGINKENADKYLSDGLHQNDLGDELLSKSISEYLIKTIK